jgi:hypothetical protein
MKYSIGLSVSLSVFRHSGEFGKPAFFIFYDPRRGNDVISYRQSGIPAFAGMTELGWGGTT